MDALELRKSSCSSMDAIFLILQHTAAHCSTLRHTTTHCNTLQHTATELFCKNSPNSSEGVQGIDIVF